MANETPNYHLKKPLQEDFYDIDVQNENMDSIDTELKKLEDDKVDKVSGKQLSSNDYTTVEKDKLGNIAEKANNYTHPPNHQANMIVENANKRFVSDEEKAVWGGKANASHTHVATDVIETSEKKFVSAEEKNTWNGKANSTDVNAHIADKVQHITAGERATWNATSTNFNTHKDDKDSHFTAIERTKLANVSEGANNYVHPANHPPSIIAQDANNRFMTDIERTKLASLQNYNDTALSQAISSLQTTKADKSDITTFEGTATFTSNILSIAVSNNSKTSYTVRFTAPADFNAPDMYRINGVTVTLTDLNNKPLKNAWVQGSAVTLSVVGNKAFFKSGGEFSSGDLLPVGRVGFVFDYDKITAVSKYKHIPPLTGNYIDGDGTTYYTWGSNTNYICKIKNDLSDIDARIEVQEMPASSAKTMVVTKDYVYMYGGTNGLAWVVLDKNLQIVSRKTFMGYNFGSKGITEVDDYLYVLSYISATQSKVIKLTYQLEIVDETTIQLGWREQSGITSINNYIYFTNNQGQTCKYNCINKNIHVVEGITWQSITNKLKFSTYLGLGSSNGGTSNVNYIYSLYDLEKESYYISPTTVNKITYPGYTALILCDNNYFYFKAPGNEPITTIQVRSLSSGETGTTYYSNGISVPISTSCIPNLDRGTTPIGINNGSLYWVEQQNPIAYKILEE